MKEYDKEKSGLGGDALKEEVPKFLARNGDGVITAAVPGLDGIDNNASIILGRDRTGDVSGGFGKHFNAGAIDIVVGRLSPKCPPRFNKSSGPIYTDPLFKAAIDPRVKEIKTLNTNYKEAVEPVIMDAARIYISQKTRVDDAFGIIPTTNGPLMGMNNPRSAVAIQADHVRMISREGIKIVTMGAGSSYPQNISSQGNKIIKTYGIDLIAGNGKDAQGKSITQEPLVKGHAMMRMVDEMITMVDNLTGVVATFLAQQNVINIAMLAEFGASGAGIVIMDPVSRTTGTIVGLDMIAKTGLSLANLKYKLAKFKFEHGIASTDPNPLGVLSGEEGAYKSVVANKSPLSRYNTTN